MMPDHVVPFRPGTRGGMARRGAPDKTYGLPAEAFEVECPRCAAILCFEGAPFSRKREVLCVGCEAAIPLEDAHTRAAEEIRLTR
ncbi:MAG TPA: hypothetical protein VLO07_07830 [Thermoanaerobaculia bacterium]|nr:hypothetical protein [Thermoanaerobaculia bacterium]